MFYYNGVGMVVDLQGVAHWQACPSVPICAVLLPCTEGASTAGGPCAHQVMAWGHPCLCSVGGQSQACGSAEGAAASPARLEPQPLPLVPAAQGIWLRRALMLQESCPALPLGAG